MLKSDYAALRKRLDFEVSDQEWLRTIALSAALGFTSLCLLFATEGLWPLTAIPLLSVFYFRNFSLMHEAVHGVAHSNKKINDLTGYVAGIFCFLDFKLWKELHIKHHYWTGNYHQDPALGLIKNYHSLPRPVQKTLDICWSNKLPFGAFIQHFVFWSQSFLIARKSNSPFTSFVKTVTPLFFAIALGFFMGTTACISYILGVGLYLYAVEIVNFPHHVGLYTETAEQKIPVWEQDKYARSCKYPQAIEKYFVLNFNYHVEHHLFPDLPWNQLPAAYKELTEMNFGKHPHQAEVGWISSRRDRKFAEFLEIENQQPIAVDKSA